MEIIINEKIIEISLFVSFIFYLEKKLVFAIGKPNSNNNMRRTF